MMVVTPKRTQFGVTLLLRLLLLAACYNRNNRNVLFVWGAEQEKNGGGGGGGEDDDEVVSVPMPTMYSMVYSQTEHEFSLDFYTKVVSLTEAYLNDFFTDYYADNSNNNNDVSFSQVKLYLRNESTLFLQRGREVHVGHQADIYMGGNAYYYYLTDQENQGKEDQKKVGDMVKLALLGDDYFDTYWNYLGETGDDFFTNNATTHHAGSVYWGVVDSQKMLQRTTKVLFWLGLSGAAMLLLLYFGYRGRCHDMVLEVPRRKRKTRTTTTANDGIAAVAGSGSNDDDRREELISSQERRQAEGINTGGGGMWA